MLPIATYKYTTTNIGDDIQPYAIEQLVGRRTEKVYRDHLYRQTKPVALVGNSWYFVTSPLSSLEAMLRGGRMFPPPDCVTPLYIGISISQRAEKYMLSPEGIAHLKRYSPVGCRDQHTLEMLRARGVDAYYSGCPTMTLENKYTQRDDRIYIVDTDRRPRVEGLLRRLTSNPTKGEDFTPLIPEHIRRQATTLTHLVDFGDDQEKRYAYVDNLIRAYSTARLVITTRLHVALPCAALGTPCVLLHKSDFRFTGYDFLKMYHPGNIHECDWNPETMGIPDVSEHKRKMRGIILDWVARIEGGAV
jgi:hypothetical protein